MYTETDFWDNRQSLKKRYEAKVTRAYEAVKKLLPDVPGNVSFVVQTEALDTIPETGEGGWIKHSRLVLLSIDPGLPYGEEALLTNTRHTVFHELNHAARYENGIYHKSFIDSCIMEGLATVFEREFAKYRPLYGEYDATEVEAWLEEIMNQADVDHYQYMFRHEDGRRWIGYKVGTFLVDEAMKNSGKSVQELTRLECDEIFKLAAVV